MVVIVALFKKDYPGGTPHTKLHTDAISKAYKTDCDSADTFGSEQENAAVFNNQTDAGQPLLQGYH
jgi:hypothetical protein